MLAADAKAIAAANLRMAVEAGWLRQAFADAAIELLFVKGLTVGRLAYSDPFLKMGWDIDVLIDPARLEEAAALLACRGYRLKRPESAANLRAWHRKHKESLWWRDGGLHVELHTRLTENRSLLPGVDVQSPSRQVEVAPGISLPTLAADELFAYLCVHGSSSLWFRLKWITDLAAILHGTAPADVRRLYARSQGFGAGRASGQALLLADALYGSLGGQPLKAKLESDPANRLLLKAALRQLAGRDEPVEPTSRLFGTAAIHYTQLMLQPGITFKLGEFVRQARSIVG